MGQFYKTAKPDFSQDFIYQPPWELMTKAAGMKQAQYDNALKQTSALNNLLNINHIDEDVENSHVNTEKELWESQIDDITNQIKETGDYKSAIPKIREIQKGIAQSRKDGNISRFEKSAAIKKKYGDAIEYAKKKGGDIASANAAYKTYMNKWLKQGNRSLDEPLGYEEVIKKPDVLDGDNIIDVARKIPAYSNSSFKVDPRGGWIVTTNGKEEYVTKDQLLETVQPYIMSDPNLVPYLNQRQRFGLGQYFNKDGSLISPYGVKYYDKTGKEYSIEEARKLPKEQQVDLKKKFEFANNTLGQAFSLGTSMEYSKRNSNTNLRVDQVHENALNRNQQRLLQKDRQKYGREMEKLKFNHNLKLKALLGSKKGKQSSKPSKALKDLNHVSGINSFAQIKNANIPNLFGISKNGRFDEAGKNKLDYIFKELTKGMKGDELKSYGLLLDKIKSGEISTPQQSNAFLFKQKYPTEADYIRSQPKYKDLTDNDINTAIAKLKKESDIKTNREYSIFPEQVDISSNERRIAALADRYNNSLVKGEDYYLLPFKLGNTTEEGEFKKFKNFSDRATTLLNDKYNEAAVEKEFETLPKKASIAIAETVNDHPGDFNIIDAATGHVIVDPIHFVWTRGITGASGRATSQIMLQNSEAKKFIAIPINSSSPSQLAINNIGIENLAESSRVKQQLKDRRRGDVMQQFFASKRSGEFNQSITIDDVYFGTGAKLTRAGDGITATYTITDPKFGITKKFNDKNSFLNYLDEMSKPQKK